MPISQEQFETISNLLGVSSVATPVAPPIATPIANSLNINAPYELRLSDYDILYQGCICKYQEKLIKIKGFFTNSIHENPTIEHIDVNITFLESLHNISLPLEEAMPFLDFTLPKLGLINIGKSLALVTRKHKIPSPSRYRKAFREDTFVTDILTEREDSIADIPFPSIEEIIINIFDKEYPSYEKAIHTLLSFEKMGVAFSSKYGISLCSSVNNFVLWRDKYIIGVFSRQAKAFKMNTDMFNQELLELGVKIK